jgi:hypothetical protein
MITSFENFFSTNDQSPEVSRDDDPNSVHPWDQDEEDIGPERIITNYQSPHDRYSDSYDNYDDYEEDFETLTPKASFRVNNNTNESPRSLVLNEESFRLRSISPSIASMESIQNEITWESPSRSERKVSIHSRSPAASNDNDLTTERLSLAYRYEDDPQPNQSRDYSSSISSENKSESDNQASAVIPVAVYENNIEAKPHKEWVSAHKTTKTKRISQIDFSSDQYPVISLHDQVTGAFPMYSSVKKVDYFTETSLQQHANREMISSTGIVDQQRKRAHAMHEKLSAHKMLKDMIQDAAKAIVATDKRHALLEQASIPAPVLLGGCIIDDLASVDENSMPESVNDEPDPVQAKTFAVIKESYRKSSYMDPTHASRQRSIHEPTAKPILKATTKESIKISAIPPVNIREELDLSKSDRRKTKLISSMDDDAMVKTTTTHDDILLDEFARICVTRPDIASKCEDYYAKFLSGVIGKYQVYFRLACSTNLYSILLRADQAT